MGEIADDIVNGACCQYCGIYFLEAYGYPTPCQGCRDDELVIGDIEI